MAENKRKRDEEEGVNEEKTEVDSTQDFSLMQDKPSEAKKQVKHDVEVILKITCNEGGKESVYKVKKRCQIRKFLMGFCKHAEIDYTTTRFVIRRKDFLHTETVNQLGLKDGAQIDALVDGNGG